jgi:nicotinamidase-related amidase
VFSAANGFAPHGMGYMTGPRGAELIQEVEFAYANDEWFRVPHHTEIIDSNTREGSLQLVEFDPEVFEHVLTDPKIPLRIEKNGEGSYDVWKNPNFKKAFEYIVKTVLENRASLKANPLRIIVSGWATDFCVEAAVMAMSLLLMH